MASCIFWASIMPAGHHSHSSVLPSTSVSTSVRGLPWPAQAVPQQLTAAGWLLKSDRT